MKGRRRRRRRRKKKKKKKKSKVRQDCKVKKDIVRAI